MSVGYLLSAMLGHLPLLAVLIVGFILVASRSARMGPRRVLFARLGMAALALGSILGIAWTVLLPTLYSRLDYSVTRYGLLFSGFGLVTALLSAAGIGLLIAAVVSRGPEPGFAGGPSGGGTGFGGGPPAGGTPFAGQPYSGDQPYSSSQPYGAGDQPAGPPPGTG